MKRAKKKSVIENDVLRRIAGLARIIESLANSTFNILVTMDDLRRYFSKLRLKVVSDADMPKYEARAYPKQWLIKIREGVYQGLLRGDVRARWTLAHELGHVLLHSRRLPRPRDPKEVRPIDEDYEKQANFFASVLLAPYEEAIKCKSARELAAKFYISLDAAQVRFKEIKLEEVRRRYALNKGLQSNTFAVETHHTPRLESQVAHVCAAISATIAENSLQSNEPIQALRNNTVGAAIVTVAASHLLLEAYESTGSVPVAFDYRTAGALAAAILFIQPIRLTRQPAWPASNDTLVYNQQCALRAATALMGIRLGQIDSIKIGIPDYTDLQIFDSAYLRPFLASAEALLKNENSILTLIDFPRYEKYNETNDICWTDARDIEYLMELIMLLAMAGRDAKGSA